MSANDYGLDQERSALGRIGVLLGAILACMALTCAIASTASAKEQVGFFIAGEESENEEEQPRFEAEAYSAFPFGAGDGYHKWGFQSGDLECPVDFSGQLSGADSGLNLATFVYYFACSNPYNVPMTIEANGCEDAVDLLNAGPPYVGEFGIACPSESPYRFNFHINSEVACVISIPAQSGLDEVTFSNTGEGAERSIDVAFDVSGLKYTISGPKLICKSGEYENGTYSGTVTLDGFDEPW